MINTRPILAGVLCLSAFFSVAIASGDVNDLILVEVNGEAITGADLDKMIMEVHQSGMDPANAEGLVPKLIEKSIRDRLILQDAYGMGMGEDPALVGPVEREATRKAISLYSRSQVDLPEVTDADVEEYFETYYHKVRIRQMACESDEACRAAMARVESGEITMGSLANESSLDPLKDKGGLQNELYWVDVDFAMRDMSTALEIGEFSEPFLYKGRWTFIRVESRTPPDMAELPERKNYIHGVIRNYEYEIIWDEMVARHLDDVSVQVNEELVEGIRADEALLYHGEFRVGSEAPVLAIDPGHFVGEQDFRIAMSKLAMQMGDSSFEEILEESTRAQTEQLVLAWFAEREGYFETPEVVELYERRMDEEVINAYLEEMIAQKVALNRDEYEQFYRDHVEDFRGPEEVRLSILTANDEQVIREAASRLGDGADFDYVRAQIEGRDSSAAGEAASWSPVTVFSDEIQSSATTMQVGDSSDPIRFGYGWLIFRLDGRREGTVKPIEEVDGQIRAAMYYQQFGERLDEHLARLKEASVIVRHEDRIREWARGES